MIKWKHQDVMKENIINIQIILYFSSGHLPKLLSSIKNLDVKDQKVCFFLVDQSENENEYNKVLKEWKNFKEINGISLKLSKQRNYGFGKGHNEIYRKNKKVYKDFFIILNPDSILHSDLIINISRYLDSLKDIRWGLLELKQFPSENPKSYNPVTLETNWASGAGTIINCNAFKKVGMFDENICMYGEDVDLSIRMRIAHYLVLTLPNAKFTHLTKDTDISKESDFTRVNKQAAELYLRYKFAKDSDVKAYMKLFGEEDPHFEEIVKKYKSMRRKLKKRTFYKDFVDKNQDYTNFRWVL